MTTPSTGQVTGEPIDEPAESSTTLDADERFHLLQNQRRRQVLRYLQDADTDPESDTDDGRVWMRDIAEQVAAWEHDTTVAQLSSTQRQRVYIPLYQNHLPKLDDAGVIDYDQSRGVVVPTDRADRLAQFLARADSNSDADDRSPGADTWNGYYLGASGVGAAMLGGAALSLFPGFLVAATILALFSTVSLSQYLSGALDRDGDGDGQGGA